MFNQVTEDEFNKFVALNEPGFYLGETTSYYIKEDVIVAKIYGDGYGPAEYFIKN